MTNTNCQQCLSLSKKNLNLRLSIENLHNDKLNNERELQLVHDKNQDITSINYTLTQSISDKETEINILKDEIIKLKKNADINLSQSLEQNQFQVGCKDCTLLKDSLRVIRNTLKDLNLQLLSKEEKIKNLKNHISYIQSQRKKLNDENCMLQQEFDLRNKSAAQETDGLIEKMAVVKALCLSQRDKLSYSLSNFCHNLREIATLALHCFLDDCGGCARTKKCKEFVDRYKRTKIRLLSYIESALAEFNELIDVRKEISNVIHESRITKIKSPSKRITRSTNKRIPQILYRIKSPSLSSSSDQCNTDDIIDIMSNNYVPNVNTNMVAPGDVIGDHLESMSSNDWQYDDLFVNDLRGDCDLGNDLRLNYVDNEKEYTAVSYRDCFGTDEEHSVVSTRKVKKRKGNRKEVLGNGKRKIKGIKKRKCRTDIDMMEDESSNSKTTNETEESLDNDREIELVLEFSDDNEIYNGFESEVLSKIHNVVEETEMVDLDETVRNQEGECVNENCEGELEKNEIGKQFECVSVESQSETDEREHPISITVQDTSLAPECVSLLSDSSIEEEDNAELSRLLSRSLISTRYNAVGNVDSNCLPIDLSVPKPMNLKKELLDTGDSESLGISSVLTDYHQEVDRVNIIISGSRDDESASIGIEEDCTAPSTYGEGHKKTASASVEEMNKIAENEKTSWAITDLEANNDRFPKNVYEDERDTEEIFEIPKEAIKNFEKEMEELTKVQNKSAVALPSKEKEKSIMKHQENYLKQGQIEEIKTRTEQAKEIIKQKTLQGNEVPNPRSNTDNNQAINIAQFVADKTRNKSTNKKPISKMDKISTRNTMLCDMRPINDKTLVIMERTTKQQLDSLRAANKTTDYVAGNKRLQSHSDKPDQLTLCKRQRTDRPHPAKERIPSKLMDVKIAQMLSRKLKVIDLERFQQLSTFVNSHELLGEVALRFGKYHDTVSRIFKANLATATTEIQQKIGSEIMLLKDWNLTALVHAILDFVSHNSGDGVPRRYLVQATACMIVNVIMLEKDQYKPYYDALLAMMANNDSKVLINLVSINITVLNWLQQPDLIVAFIVDLIRSPMVPMLLIARCLPPSVIVTKIATKYDTFVKLMKLLVVYEYSTTSHANNRILFSDLPPIIQQFWLDGRNCGNFDRCTDLDLVVSTVRRTKAEYERLNNTKANWKCLDKIIHNKYK